MEPASVEVYDHRGRLVNLYRSNTGRTDVLAEYGECLAVRLTSIIQYANKGYTVSVTGTAELGTRRWICPIITLMTLGFFINIHRMDLTESQIIDLVNTVYFLRITGSLHKSNSVDLILPNNTPQVARSVIKTLQLTGAVGRYVSDQPVEIIDPKL